MTPPQMGMVSRIDTANSAIRCMAPADTPMVSAIGRNTLEEKASPAMESPDRKPEIEAKIPKVSSAGSGRPEKMPMTIPKALVADTIAAYPIWAAITRMTDAAAAASAVRAELMDFGPRFYLPYSQRSGSTAH